MYLYKYVDDNHCATQLASMASPAFSGGRVSKDLNIPRQWKKDASCPGVFIRNKIQN